MNISLSRIVIFIFGIFLLIRLIMAPYEIYKEQRKQVNQTQKEAKQFATPDELTQSHLRGLTIRIADLVREGNIIKGKVFEDCDIYGPALIGPLNNNIIVQSTLEGTIGSNFIVIQNKYIIGAIGIENCVFKRCHFIRIGFVGPLDVIEIFKKGFATTNQ